MTNKHFTTTTKRGGNHVDQVFSFRQVQTAFRRLLEEEANLIQDDQLPPRTGLLAELFTRMSFDNQPFIGRDFISEKQAVLVVQYS